MQEGDFGKRAVMKYLRTKCRWGWWWDALQQLEVPKQECGCLQHGYAACGTKPGLPREVRSLETLEK